MKGNCKHGIFKRDNRERIVISLIIGSFSVLILLCYIEELPFTLATDDLETAMRIFDGVGVEGLSAIFAIAISLSLMAVQFASQKYTHRIMDIHIKSGIFMSVIAIYLVSMLYNVVMLGRLPLVDHPRKYVEISMLLTSLSFIMLIPYFGFTMRRLRPESVISNLLAKIDEDYLNSINKRYIKEGELRIPSKADKMLPITDVIEKSISSGDRETARFGIDEIYSCYMSHLKKENEDYVSRYFLAKHILGIGSEAVIEKDDDSMVQVLKIFGMVGTRAINENLNVSARKSVECIKIIGFDVLKDYDVAAQQMIDSLQGMLREIINSGNEEILGQIFTLYHDTSDKLFTLEKDQKLKYTENSVSKLLDSMMKKYLFSWDSVPEDDNEKLIKFLRDDFDIDWAKVAEITKSDDGMTINISTDENSAEIMMDENKEKAILKISDGKTYNLKVKTENGKLNIYMKNECYDILERTAGLLESIGIFAVKHNIRDALHQSVHSLYKIGLSFAKDKLVWETPKGTVITAERIIDHLLKIEEETLKYKSKLKEFNSIINEIMYARKDIEKYLEEEVFYLFSWDNVPGDDNEKLIRFLIDDFGIDWAKNAEIRKSSDSMTINISKDANSAEIMMDENKEKAILKINDGKIHELKVKTEDDKLNIYYFFKDLWH